MSTPSAADAPVYTLASWRVTPGREADFIAAWEELSAIFLALPDPPLEGTLVRSTTDPSLFYSFGPWRSAQHIAVMRADARVAEALGRVAGLCADAQPGTFTVAARAPGSTARRS